MFRFANPQYLWLLLAIPALVLIFWAAAARRRKRLARFGNPGVLEELMPEVSTGRTALEVHPFLHGRRPAHTGCGTPAVRVEAPRGEGAGRGDDARGRRLELDAGRGFRTQPARAHQICHQQTFRRAQARPRGADRLRGRTEGTAAHHVGLPYGEGLRQAHRPVAGVGTGHGHRQGAVNRRCCRFRAKRKRHTAGSSSW